MEKHEFSDWQLVAHGLEVEAKASDMAKAEQALERLKAKYAPPAPSPRDLEAAFRAGHSYGYDAGSVYGPFSEPKPRLTDDEAWAEYQAAHPPKGETPSEAPKLELCPTCKRHAYLQPEGVCVACWIKDRKAAAPGTPIEKAAREYVEATRRYMDATPGNRTAEEDARHEAWNNLAASLSSLPQEHGDDPDTPDRIWVYSEAQTVGLGVSTRPIPHGTEYVREPTSTGDLVRSHAKTLEMVLCSFPGKMSKRLRHQIIDKFVGRVAPRASSDNQEGVADA